MSPYWSYLLTAVGVFGLWVVGRKDRRGFVVGIFAQTLWFAYAVSIQQWGFIVSCLAYGWVNINNPRKWQREERPSRDRNPMVRSQKWRYWAHRFGWIRSPSCGAAGIPFGRQR